MIPWIVRNALLCCCLTLCAVPAARAQWAVIDAPAIVQLIQEVQTLEQQLQTARAELSQAQQAYRSMTGGRGMEQLLSGSARNYLPADWSQVMTVIGGGAAGYSGLSGDIQGLVSANAILSAQQLSALAPAQQREIQADRQWSALRQALARQALSTTSGRFGSLQSLIAAIPAAADQKGVLDLQARISAELGMLQNEQTKLEVLDRATLAQEAAAREQAHEQAIAGHGRFETRFQPVP